MFVFKVSKDCKVASHNGQILDEWTGKSVALFSKAMGRRADRAEKFDIAGRKWIEFIWDED